MIKLTLIKFANLKQFFVFKLHNRLKREEEGESDFQMDQAQHRSSSDRLSDNDEKKMRRQIANSNERRRMQSINAGFQTLRHRLPQHEGEKLSKVDLLKL